MPLPHSLPAAAAAVAALAVAAPVFQELHAKGDPESSSMRSTSPSTPEVCLHAAVGRRRHGRDRHTCSTLSVWQLDTVCSTHHTYHQVQYPDRSHTSVSPTAGSHPPTGCDLTACCHCLLPRAAACRLLTYAPSYPRYGKPVLCDGAAAAGCVEPCAPGFTRILGPGQQQLCQAPCPQGAGNPSHFCAATLTCVAPGAPCPRAAMEVPLLCPAPHQLMGEDMGSCKLCIQGLRVNKTLHQ
jgi:hypothetical protein